MRRFRFSLVYFQIQSRLSCNFENVFSPSSRFNLEKRTTIGLRNLSWFSTYRGETSVTSQLLSPQSQSGKQVEEWRNECSFDPRHRGQQAQEGIPGGEVDYSVLQEKISSAGTTGELLDVVEGFNSKAVDERVLMTILQTLFTHLKSERSDSTKKDVLNSVGMQKVCKVLRQHCRWMTPNDLLTSCKVLIFINAPSNHNTLGVLLHLLSKHANSLTLKEIIYFHFLLNRTPESPITNALQVALPIVFESQLNVQLDIEDLTTLTDSLHYAVRSSLSDKTIQLICDGLIRSKELLNSKQAVSILCSLSDLKRSFPYQETLLTSIFKRICSTINCISTEDLITCGNKVSRKVGKSTPEFYNEAFVNALCSRILREDVKPVHALFLLKPISLMKHVNTDILEKISDITLANPTTVLNSDYFFMSLIRTFSGANYKPDKWSHLAQIFLEHPAMTKDLGHQEVAIAADFLAIDVLPCVLVTKIFSAENIRRLEEFVKKTSPHLLLLLLNAMKMLYSKEYHGPLPPKSMVEKWKAQVLTIPKRYPLKGALEAGFGGQSYLVTGLFHEGFHIDHAVVMRKGGYPISIKTSEPEILSNLLEHVPVDSSVVMVKSFLSESYAKNTNRLRGVNALELKILEKMGHPVIAIDVQRWKELQDFEKIPYLMHRIREKSEKFYQSGPNISIPS